MKLPKTILLLIIISFLFSSFYSLARAQEPIPQSSLEKFQQNLKNCADNETTSMECWIGGPEQVSEKPEAATGVMPAVANSLTTMIIGPLCQGEECAYRPGGAIGGIANLIAAMYANPPASSVEYFADLGRNLGILAKPAYAQGFGFEGLRPILPLWKTFRNIAYLFFTVVFVVIGFAIMFRVKLDPQTVISIQNAIPRIVVALILVTFSYAIAGLLIDLIYIAIGLVVTILTGPAPLLPKDQAAELQQQILTGGVPQMAGSMFRTGFEAIVSLGKAFAAQATLIGALIGAVIGGLATLPAGGAGAIPGGLAGALAPSAIVVLIISIAILYAIFKLFFSLLMAYIGIITSIIFAPLKLMTDVLPGQSGFGGWLHNLLANLAVFPAVTAMLLLGRILTSAGSQGLWSPPLMWSGTAAVTQALIGLGIILMTPKVAEMVKEALQVKPFPYGAAIGEPFRVITTPVRGIAGGAIEGYAQTLPGNVVKGILSTIGKKTAGG